MGISKDNPKIEWIIPQNRGIMPVGKIYCSKSLKRIIYKNEFDISFNQNFKEVINNCAK